MTLQSNSGILIKVNQNKNALSINPESLSPRHMRIYNLDPQVFAEFDDHQILDLILGKLESDELLNEDLLFCGLAGESVHENGDSFGQRETTWGVTAQQFEDAIERSSDQNPINYLSFNGGSLPAIGVFDVTKLKESERPPATSGDLYDEGTYVQGDLPGYWQTKDGASLDDATVAIFYFNK